MAGEGMQEGLCSVYGVAAPQLCQVVVEGKWGPVQLTFLVLNKAMFFFYAK